MCMARQPEHRKCIQLSAPMWKQIKVVSTLNNENIKTYLERLVSEDVKRNYPMEAL